MREIDGRTVQIDTPRTARAEEVLTAEALQFLVDLHVRFDPRRQELLAQRGGFRSELERGESPDFPHETQHVRQASWKVVAPPKDLADRRVEITGPTDRKMIINALNSGARVYMADFEDAHSPTWSATVAGQVNLQDAVRRRITYTAPDGRDYRLRESLATLMVRPRGWHLDDRHVTIDGRPISASLFDFGLYFFHNATELLRRGTGPYFYVPKMEHYLEARLWNEVFVHAQERLGIPRGSIRATALIETLPASLQMDEILYELREHSAGLNCGRWDFLFSFIKQFRNQGQVRFPDRDRLSMDTPFLTAYSHLLIQTCHRRGAHAMGGMAAQIPIKDRPEENAAAIAKVIADKEREVRAGHDGTWVAHPGLVSVAREVFDQEMQTPNQIDRPPPPESITPRDLMVVPAGPVTGAGVRRNTRVAFLYLESWLRGIGCVPIDHLMEDAATAEIARTELWHWIHHSASTDDGGPVDRALFQDLLSAEVAQLRESGPATEPSPSIDKASQILIEVVTASQLEEFITSRAYGDLGDSPSEGGG
ncbi:MAG: malate synthase A [Thermoplasmata archaeon]